MGIRSTKAIQTFFDDFFRTGTDALREGGAALDPTEYVFFGDTGTTTAGSLTGLGDYSSIKVAGTGAGGSGDTVGYAAGAGGGAASNVVGEAFSVPGNGITSIYYEVGGTDGEDTFVQINGPGGTDLIRFSGGTPGASGGGAGGTATGGGTNCVAGTAGASNASRYNAGPPAVANPNGCAGGGGAGGGVNNGQPGTVGGTGGASALTATVITTNSSGPAPTTWSISSGPNAGGAGGYGSTAGNTNGTNAGDALWAQGGGGAGVQASPLGGNHGAGGAGAGVKWVDPSDSTNNGKLFGGGGGNYGAPQPSEPTDAQGGKGFLIIQLS